jgi:hypothetical protein
MLHRITIAILKHSKINHVSVTPEIKETLALHSKYDFYIQNGYKEDTLHLLKQLPQPLLEILESIKPNRIGIFVGHGYGWHGINELIQKTQNIPNVHILIVGPYPETQSTANNIHFTGILSQGELKTLYQYADFGIGPLRYDHIKLTKGASLKIREYLYNGLMLWLHFDDCVTDFEDLRPYIFMEEHLNTLLQTYPNKNDIKDLAKKYLSWENVMKPLISCIQKEVKK